MIRYIAFVLFAWAGLAWLSPLHAYTTITTDLGDELHWNSMPINWYADSDGAPGLGFGLIEQTLQSAFNTWDAVECSSLSFAYMGATSKTSTQVGTTDYDSQNVMIWIDENDWPGEWSDAYAVTVPLFDTLSGRILDADILFNKNFGWSAVAEGQADKADVLNIAVHEIGHLIGLDHTPGLDATMYYASLSGETYKRSLAADDIQGVCYLYPEPGLTGFPCASDGDCLSGRRCVEHSASGGSICAAVCQCAPDCSAAFTCLGGYCLPPEVEVGGLGSECTTTIPCDNGFICVSGLCTNYCSDVSDCPDGWQCQSLVGGGKACYTNDPDLLDGDDDPVVTLTRFDVTPPEAAPLGMRVSLACEAESEDDSPLMYQFLVRPIGGEWDTLKNYSTLNNVQWAPENEGAFELKAEVKRVDSDACAEAEETRLFTVADIETDGDASAADGDTPPDDDDGGCRHIPSSHWGLLFLGLALLRRRTRRPQESRI